MTERYLVFYPINWPFLRLSVSYSHRRHTDQSLMQVLCQRYAYFNTVTHNSDNTK